MLYNTEWDKPKKETTDIWSLGSLISWLEKQNPDESYTYNSCGCCLLAQYFTAMGLHKVWVTRTEVSFKSGWFVLKKTRELPPFFDVIAVGNRKFGGALKDAKALAIYCPA